MEDITSLINGQIVTKYIEKGRTELFFDEQEARKFAADKRSYYYKASHVGLIVFCVPK